MRHYNYPEKSNDFEQQYDVINKVLKISKFKTVNMIPYMKKRWWARA